MNGWGPGHLEHQGRAGPLLWGPGEKGAAVLGRGLKSRHCQVKGYRCLWGLDEALWLISGPVHWGKQFVSSSVERIRPIPSAVVEADCCLSAK